MNSKTLSILFGSTNQIYEYLEKNKIKEKIIIRDNKVDLNNLSGFFDIITTNEHYKDENNLFIVIDDFNIDKVENIVTYFSEFIVKYNIILKGILLVTQEEMDEMDESHLDRLSEIFGEEPELLSSKDTNNLGIPPHEMIEMSETDIKIYQLAGVIDNLMNYYGSEHASNLSESVPININQKIEYTFENIVDRINTE